MTVQPLRDQAGNVLCWNGEIFGGGLNLNPLENDTSALMRLFAGSPSPLAVLSQVQGPWACVYYHNDSHTLWFGRDHIGRRSLLLSRPPGALALSSVATRSAQFAWEELSVSHMYSVDLSKICAEGVSPIQEHTRTLPPPFQTLTPSLDSLPPTLFPESALKFKELLSAAVRVRVQNLPPGKAVGLLFSGGLDSTVLAALADLYIDPALPIDLINVAFGVEPFEVPDRLSGFASLADLKRIAPTRQWNFVEVNVSAAELDEHKDHVATLIYPCNTVMDLTLGSALWFAARGKGVIRKPDGTIQNVTSNARVLLLGNGADEQLAGYGRHRTAFRHRGWDGLQSELEKDTLRLWKRNLGRDDRIVSDHGREVRQPYLDCNVVHFISALPLYIVCDLREKHGVGDKKILREVGRLLGLEACTVLAKRAIQFGSRIAKVVSPNSLGTDSLDTLEGND